MIDMSHEVCILAPAKINLFLKVRGKYCNEYHDLCTLMLPVSLFDFITLNFKRDYGISVISNNIFIPSNENNLITRAISLFIKEISLIGFHFTNGVSVNIKKRIPIGSGFGGGSSDAAAVLLSLNHKFGYPFSNEKLIEIAKDLGSDVPFFIFKRPALIRGHGCDLTFFCGKLPKFAVLIHTGLTVSTKWVYRKLKISRNLGLTKEKKIIRDVRFKNELQQFEQEYSLFNDLELVTENSAVFEIREHLIRLDALYAIMSGSGSGVFGLFKNFVEANMAVKALLKLEIGCRCFARVVTLLI